MPIKGMIAFLRENVCVSCYSRYLMSKFCATLIINGETSKFSKNKYKTQ